MADAVLTRSRGSVVAIWLLRGFLALLFIFVGAIKFPGDPRSAWVHIFGLIGFGQWFRVATAIIECVGGVLLLVPRATPIAVALLAPTMVGALLVHIFVVGIGRPSVAVLVLLSGVLLIGWTWSKTRGRTVD
jgi:putative oxidoreductase